MAEGLGNGCACKETVQKKHTGRNIAIGAGVTLGVAAVIMGTVALSKISTLREGIQHEASVRSADFTTQNNRVDSLAKAHDLKFVATDSTIKTVQLSMGQKADASAVNGQAVAVNARVDSTNTAVSAVEDKVCTLEEAVTRLGITDTEIKAALGKAFDKMSLTEKDLELIKTYAQVCVMISDKNQHRGGLLGLFKSGEVPQPSYQDFLRLANQLGPNISAKNAFQLWLLDRGIIEPKK